MTIIRRIPWTRYPESPQINTNHWQGQNLLSFWPLVNGNSKSLKDIAGHNDAINHTSAPDYGVIPAAQALGRKFNADGIRVSTADSWGTLFGGAGRDESHTLVFKFRSNSATARQYLFGDFDNSNTNHSYYIRLDAAGTFTGQIICDTSNPLFWQVSSWSVDTVYTCAFVMNWEGGNVELWLNGVNVASSSLGSNTSLQDRGGSASIACYGMKVGVEAFDGDMWDFRVYKGTLKAAQHLEIHQFPHRIFLPRVQVLNTFVAAAGGGSLSIPVAMNSYRQRQQFSVG